MRFGRIALVVSTSFLFGAAAVVPRADRVPRPVSDPTTTRPGPASSCRAWSEGATRRWGGTWRGSDGFVFTHVLTLRRQGARVAGQFDWTLTVSPEPGDRYVGRSAIERVRGTVDCARGALDFAGYEVTDAQLLEADVYRLRLRADGTFTGESRGHAPRWTSAIDGSPQ